MADRKGRSVVFKTPATVTLKEIKDALTAEIGPNNLTVLQQLPNGDFLIETTTQKLASDIIESEFSLQELHVPCNPPPRGYYVNVSIMGLRAYIDDADLIKALEPYGEIKGEVIRLKYKADHDLAGLENGNRLVRMVLTTPSIPYSLKIADEWCRIIHNNQQPVCRECSQLGHSHRKCPTIKCNLCKATGHMSMDCDKRFDFPPWEQQTEALTTTPEQTQEHQTDTTPPETPTNLQPDSNTTPMDSPSTEQTDENLISPPDPPHILTPTPMDSSISLKRSHTTDSDSDNPAHKPIPRRPRMAPKPNITVTRNKASPPTGNK